MSSARPRRAWLRSLWGLGLPLALGALLLVSHLAGWKEHTSLLSGTSPGSATALSQGLIYVFAWFAFVTLAPIAALSALLDWALARLLGAPAEDRCARALPELGCGLGGERPDAAIEE